MYIPQLVRNTEEIDIHVHTHTGTQPPSLTI